MTPSCQCQHTSSMSLLWLFSKITTTKQQQDTKQSPVANWRPFRACAVEVYAET